MTDILALQLETLDWVIIAVPSTGETHHMISAQELAAMKSNAVPISPVTAFVPLLQCSKNAFINASPFFQPGSVT